VNKLLHSLLLSLALSISVVLTASAVFIEERLEDPAQEERAREISEGIRCLVCQNQSILDSNADLARDLRQVVRERILLGDSDDAVREYLVVRYGDWVLLNPPFKLRTYLLWFGPIIIFVVGLLALGLFIRRKSREAVSETIAPLSAEEQAEIDSLLTPDGDQQK
jgi:cytochrome c-type biogenesis protein CcmH